jgi:hypothetical protein
MSEIDISSVTASLINHQIDSFKSWFEGRIKSLWVKNISNFKDYYKKSHKKYGYTKTILYKEKSVPLSQLYVGTNLKDEHGKPVKDYTIVKKLEEGQNILITATAGAGKSFFAKFLFLAIIERGKKIPVFIEFRNLADPSASLIDNIIVELSRSNILVSREIFIEMIQSGRFIFILDGYDEIASINTANISQGLRELVDINSECSVVVTSRPDDQIEYLQHFTNYQIQPLNLEQAATLIEKLEYDKKVKSLFIENLNKGLFKKHKDFLSNPLLLTILLMTYGEIAEIPAKIHIFYEQAFDVLFCKHDASKGMYRREVKSGLPIDDFKNVLASVSASGYIRGQTSFADEELLKYIGKAKDILMLDSLSAEKFKEDLLKTVCILINDGNKYSYNHRSFQEYFAALFLLKTKSDNKLEIYLRYIDRGAWDNALYLAFEIDRKALEFEFILPILNQIFFKYGYDPIAHLRSWFDGFDIRSIRTTKGGMNPYYGIKNPKREWEILRFLERVYSNSPQSFNSSIKILTNERFESVFGTNDVSKSISFEPISKDNLDILEKLGIMETVKIRIKFMQSIKNQLDKSAEKFLSNSLDDWL